MKHLRPALLLVLSTALACGHPAAKPAPVPQVLAPTAPTSSPAPSRSVTADPGATTPVLADRAAESPLMAAEVAELPREAKAAAANARGDALLASDDGLELQGLSAPSPVVAQRVGPARRIAGVSAQPMAAERYAHQPETGFRQVSEQPLSTFSVDVDTASYSNLRRFIDQGQLPPPAAVRVEELVNYFSYELPPPAAEHPISVLTDVTESPFNAGRQLVRVSLHASAPKTREALARNLVLLIDTSGSMQAENKLPLLQASLRALVQQLGERDRVAIVTYAGTSGVALQPTSCAHKQRIIEAIEQLGAEGSTHGAAGIREAYALAGRHFDAKAINRVILATDGDFNVGVTDEGSLVRMIEQERERGVFLTVLGFGMGNLNDSTMEKLADHGNGAYAYIDTLREGRKVLVEQIGSTLSTVAKDTKLQIEWNPARVASYRLIGYENRRLADEAFNDDKKDAGDMGDGHSVTALYEIERRGASPAAAQVDPLKYQAARSPSAAADSSELMTIKVRYKGPADARSKLLVHAVEDRVRPLSAALPDTRFAAAVAGFGMLLGGSQHGALRYDAVRELALTALGADRDGYRAEFLTLVARARQIARAD